MNPSAASRTREPGRSPMFPALSSGAVFPLESNAEKRAWVDPIFTTTTLFSRVIVASVRASPTCTIASPVRTEPAEGTDVVVLVEEEGATDEVLTALATDVDTFRRATVEAMVATEA